MGRRLAFLSVAPSGVEQTILTLLLANLAACIGLAGSAVGRSLPGLLLVGVLAGAAPFVGFGCRLELLFAASETHSALAAFVAATWLLTALGAQRLLAGNLLAATPTAADRCRMGLALALVLALAAFGTSLPSR